MISWYALRYVRCGAMLLGNMLTGKGVGVALAGHEVVQDGNGVIRNGQNFYSHHIFPIIRNSRALTIRT